jgi:K+-transporting ATPase KdpF subunit
MAPNRVSIFYEADGKCAAASGKHPHALDPRQSPGSLPRLGKSGIGAVARINRMIIEYVLGGLVTAALLVYLTYVLLRPERF